MGRRCRQRAQVLARGRFQRETHADGQTQHHRQSLPYSLLDDNRNPTLIEHVRRAAAPHQAGESATICLQDLSLGVRGARGEGWGWCLVCDIAARAPEQSASVELGVAPFFEKSRFRFVVADGGSTGVRGTTRWYSPPAKRRTRHTSPTSQHRPGHRQHRNLSAPKNGRRGKESTPAHHLHAAGSAAQRGGSQSYRLPIHRPSVAC